jgi:hypothetical protein
MKNFFLGVIIGFTLSYFFLTYTYLYGNRKFYCLTSDKCITVWKTGDGGVYIIPGIYKKLRVPDISYIQTDYDQSLILYFSDSLPNKIIVENAYHEKSYFIQNKYTSKWKFVNYSDKYDSLLHKRNATKTNEVKSGVDYIFLDIHGDFAINKEGKRL